MSRTNPYKLKRRSANRTLLVFGEGLSEEMFLKHLRNLYAYNSNVAVTIRKGKGGTAYGIVVDADNTPGAFEKKVVVLDNDKGEAEIEHARREAKQRGIDLLENSPCLEAVLLSILNSGKSYAGRGSAWCKSEFESKYLDKKKRTEPNEYLKLFPKELLDKQRATVHELNRMIVLMEGAF